MNRLDRVLLPLSAAVLCVITTGCGQRSGSKPPPGAGQHSPAVVNGSSVGSQSSAPPHGGAFGYYAFRYRGTRGTALIPALPRDDARIAEVDAYRVKAGISTIGYTIVDIDNTHGSSMLDVGEVTVFPVKGANWEANTGPDEVLPDWKAPQAVVDRYRAQARVGGVAVGLRASFVLLAEFPLTEKPRKVLVSLDDQHAVWATLVRKTHPYAGRGLAETGK